jgi:Zn-dependent protease
VLRFRLGSISVVVHPAHFLSALALGLGSGVPEGVPPAAGLAVWVVLVFVSVLFHELGHALAFRAFGYPSTIHLVVLGGVTSPEIDRPLPWGKDVVSTLAGPFFGMSLGLLCLWLMPRASGPLMTYALGTGALTNLVWAMFNLLPVLPMDGGRFSRAILHRLFGHSGVVASHALGVLVCAAVAFVLYRSGYGGPITLLFLLMFAFQNFQALMATWREEREPPTPPQLQEAERLFQAGELARARVLASELLREDTPAGQRDRLHHLLGWIALKEADGRSALQHFHHLEKRGVEPQALAAALSLVGEDLKAARCWELATRETRDPNVLHEYAATLLRLGEVEAATALPGVDLGTAYQFAERIAFLRGAYSEAARFGEESLARRPSASRAYDVACAYARAGDVRRALTLLLRARELGYSDREAAASDPDLVALAGEPDFHAWLDSLGKSAAS